MSYYEVFRKDTGDTVLRHLSERVIPAWVADDAVRYGYGELAVRAMSFANWREMAEENFECGRWMEPQWDLEPIADHFAHLATHKDTGARVIRFYASEAHGLVLRTTDIAPGRYAARFYPHLSQDAVRDIATKIDVAPEVLFARTADEMEEVYTNGPNSCMAHKACEYSSPFHPVRVYAAGDLAVAYLRKKDGKASARVLCWPEKKQYSRIYGDELRLRPLLEAMGWQNDNLHGARLTKHEDDEGCLVVPYLDTCGSVSDHGDFLKMDRHGDIDAQSTNGLVEIERQWCERCEDTVPMAHDMSRVRVGTRAYQFETWCEHCAEHNTFYCDHEHELCADDLGATEVRVRAGRTETWSERAVEDHAFYCDGAEEYVSHGYSDPVELQDTNETVSLAYAEAHCHCDDDGEWFKDEPVAEIEGGRDEHPDQLTFDDNLTPQPVAQLEAA